MNQMESVAGGNPSSSSSSSSSNSDRLNEMYHKLTMMMNIPTENDYESVIGTRYLAPELSPLLGKESRVLTMRRLWLSLARIQKKMGLVDIPDEAMEEMKKKIQEIDLEKIETFEEEVEKQMIIDRENFKRLYPEKYEREEKDRREKEMIERLHEEEEAAAAAAAAEREDGAGEDGTGEDGAGEDGTGEDGTGDGEEKEKKREVKEIIIRNPIKEVMMNLRAFEELCPSAKGYLNRGVTYSFISENCDLILMKKAVTVLTSKLFLLINYLMKRSHDFIDTPLLTYNPTRMMHVISLGKKIAMWNSDLMDIFDQWIKISFPLRGFIGLGDSKESTPDQPFAMFDGDVRLCYQFNTELAREFDVSPNKVQIVSGKSAMRVFDVHMSNILASLSHVVFRLMKEIRYLAAQEELSEGYSLDKEEESIILKMTPMVSERVISLTRYVVIQELGMAQSYINNWLNRSLNDSPMKRVVMPEIFLLTEHIIDCTYIIFNKITYHTNVIDENVKDFIYHINREELVMRAEQKGIPRREIEERLRRVIVEYEKFEKSERERERIEEESRRSRMQSSDSWISEGGFGSSRQPPPWKTCNIDIKVRQERAKNYYRIDPLLVKLIDLDPVSLNFLSLNTKDYIGNAPNQVFQLNQFFSSKTSSLFWIK